MLQDQEKQQLMKIAKQTLELFVTKGQIPSIQDSHPSLSQLAGAFVTLYKKDQLRGCIGTFQANEPLYQVVQRMTQAAASQDPRFEAVTADELAQIHLEISVLTPRHTIKSIEEIEIGTHGLYVTRGSHSGVLLPQVATEHGWDRETFLAHTCQKAGMDAGAWKDPHTKIEIFTAQICKENP